MYSYTTMFLFSIPCLFRFLTYAYVRKFHSNFSQFNKMGESFSKILVLLFLIVEPRCSLMNFRVSTTSWTLIYVSCCHCSPYLERYEISSFINNTAWNSTLVLLLSFRPSKLFTDTLPSILKRLFEKYIYIYFF